MWKIRANPWLPRLGADGVFHLSTYLPFSVKNAALRCTASTAAAPAAEQLPPCEGKRFPRALCEPWKVLGSTGVPCSEKQREASGYCRYSKNCQNRRNPAIHRACKIEDSRLPGVRQQFTQNQQTLVLQFVRAYD